MPLLADSAGEAQIRLARRLLPALGVLFWEGAVTCHLAAKAPLRLRRLTARPALCRFHGVVGVLAAKRTIAACFFRIEHR